jgi:hypothetical protein
MGLTGLMVNTVSNDGVTMEERVADSITGWPISLLQEVLEAWNVCFHT